MAKVYVYTWKKSGLSNLFCKIDLKKALDKVDWGFLEWEERVWLQMGYLDDDCVKYPWFSTLLNGTSKGFFRASKGLRQREPLSPFFSLW